MHFSPPSLPPPLLPAQRCVPHHFLLPDHLPGGGAALRRHRQLSDRHRYRSVRRSRVLPVRLHAGFQEADVATEPHR